MPATAPDAAGTALAPDALRRRVRAAWSRGEIGAAFDAAWATLDAERGRDAKALLADLLRDYPQELPLARRDDYLALLTDPDVEPNMIGVAGWHLLLRGGFADLPEATLAARIEGDALALALLNEAPVAFAAAEGLLARLRRWLLMSRRWGAHPQLADALTAQAALNGGAWPFDEAERAALTDSPMLAAYLPPRDAETKSSEVGDPVTRAVTGQYEDWPYPQWTRITRRSPSTLPAAFRNLEAAAMEQVPADADVLVAGCGTGREAAGLGWHYPDSRVTAIDVSAASLAYASRQCARNGIANVRFVRLDLHDVVSLGRRFHLIYCSGVLHHLPDPERGWRALVDALAPGGVMQIMVYNRIARLRVAGARRLIADLAGEPITDDLLRRVRRRMLDMRDHPLAAHVLLSPDFATLSGTHDLLLHRHEDPFDLERISCAIEKLGLRLFGFTLSSPQVEARYQAAYPGDPWHRDLPSLMAFERSQLGQLDNYRFWCGRSAPARHSGQA